MTPSPIHIDLEFPRVFLDFTRECEAYCVASCCGLDAFSFDEVTLRAAIERFGIEKTSEACEAGIEFAASHRSDNEECWSDQDDFNHRWHNGGEFHDWMKNLISGIRVQIQNRTEHGSDGKASPAIV